jgi:hypothetical protein
MRLLEYKNGPHFSALLNVPANSLKSGDIGVLPDCRVLQDLKLGDERLQ